MLRPLHIIELSLLLVVLAILTQFNSRLSKILTPRKKQVEGELRTS